MRLNEHSGLTIHLLQGLCLNITGIIGTLIRNTSLSISILHQYYLLALASRRCLGPLRHLNASKPSTAILQRSSRHLNHNLLLMAATRPSSSTTLRYQLKLQLLHSSGPLDLAGLNSRPGLRHLAARNWRHICMNRYVARILLTKQLALSGLRMLRAHLLLLYLVLSRALLAGPRGALASTLLILLSSHFEGTGQKSCLGCLSRGVVGFGDGGQCFHADDGTRVGSSHTRCGPLR